MAIEHQYSRFLALTGNEIAAAILTLADSQQRDDALLTVEEASSLLSLKPSGLRKIVRAGQIRHVQNGRGPIKFRREWIDEYLRSKDPKSSTRRHRQRRPTLPPTAVSGFDPRLFRA